MGNDEFQVLHAAAGMVQNRRSSGAAKGKGGAWGQKNKEQKLVDEAMPAAPRAVRSRDGSFR